MDGITHDTHPLRLHLTQEVPVHALMLVVMAGTMIVHSTLVSLAGVAALVVTSVVCAALSRTRVYLREHTVDLWAMALVILAFLPRGDVAEGGHGQHLLDVPAVVGFLVIALAWALARLWLAARQRQSARRVVVASAALTGAGLAVMAALCI